MKIAIIGAGAIGGYLAARLAHAGTSVTVIARGANLVAIRNDGLRLYENGNELVVRPDVTDDPVAAGPPIDPPGSVARLGPGPRLDWFVGHVLHTLTA
ncbi:MAG TPA: 2-dehydropantoate 2-reductase N-terminal domain-containing protein, partial [Roseiflexaceae bacterium]|nr:2-dehydropantoate 2-reductase N-terminal domain-containing protein [Roseiflexaceae bacterium]